MADRQSIMIVDDDPNIAKLIQLLLEKEGFDVTVQERGDDAVAAFQKNNGLPSNAVADPATVIEIRKQWEARTGRDMYSITKEDYTVK